MVNNLTNINNANNDLSPQLIEHKEATINADRNPGHGYGQAKGVAGLNLLIGFQLSLLDNYISNYNTDPI